MGNASGGVRKRKPKEINKEKDVIGGKKKKLEIKRIEQIPDSPPPQQLLTRVLAEEEEYRCISCVYREIISKEALVELLYYMNETGLSIKDCIIVIMKKLTKV